MDAITHDVVEVILERVPVKSLVRFKCVSKQWKSTIESDNFQKRQFIYRQQSGDPDVLFLNFQKRQFIYRQQSRDPNVLFLNFQYDDDDDDDEDDEDAKNISPSSSSVITPVKLPVEMCFFSSTSCDGLICLYNGYESNIVINPATRWHRTLPPSNFDQRSLAYQFPMLGFGKDKINGTYKLIWLYNIPQELRSPPKVTTTTCEVFDFNTNSWRYVTPSSPYEIITHIDTVYVDGSFHWLTKCEDTKILSFDLHTETFQVIAKAPFVHARPIRIRMCNLNNRLCISERNWPHQVLWLFDSGSKTLNPMYSLDLIDMPRTILLSPVTVLEDKNNNKTKLLFFEFYSARSIVLYDHETQSYDFISCSKSKGYAVSNYFQSLFSIL